MNERQLHAHVDHWREKALAAEAELERVRAERDEAVRQGEGAALESDERAEKWMQTQARLDRAVEALRLISTRPSRTDNLDEKLIASRALAEIDRKESDVKSDPH